MSFLTVLLLSPVFAGRRADRAQAIAAVEPALAECVQSAAEPVQGTNEYELDIRGGVVRDVETSQREYGSAELEACIHGVLEGVSFAPRTNLILVYPLTVTELPPRPASGEPHPRVALPSDRADASLEQLPPGLACEGPSPGTAQPDVHELLGPTRAALDACYERSLEQEDLGRMGQVTLRFSVDEGTVSEVCAVEASLGAPRVVGCMVAALSTATLGSSWSGDVEAELQYTPYREDPPAAARLYVDADRVVHALEPDRMTTSGAVDAVHWTSGVVTLETEAGPVMLPGASVVVGEVLAAGLGLIPDGRRVGAPGVEALAGSEFALTLADRPAELQACHENEVLSGAVDFRLVLDGEGEVVVVLIDRSTLGRPDVEACLARALSRQSLDPTGGLRVLMVPLAFEAPT